MIFLPYVGILSLAPGGLKLRVLTNFILYFPSPMLLCYIENVNIVRSAVTDGTSGAMVLASC